ncbi:cupin domain-containing protein [Oryzisolibacter sp. LB2S]|uniref:cupin domain-containing protein n=1 Tax=Alicycliphilus soli TaxID=3228789 RepID=UPI00345A1476
MALPHASPGQIVRLDPLGERLTESVSTALFKAAQLEVVRLVLPRGHTMRDHRVQGEITLHCLEGVIDLTVDGRTQPMHAGDLVYLAAGQPHALHAVQDSSLLLTLCLLPGV